MENIIKEIFEHIRMIHIASTIQWCWLGTLTIWLLAITLLRGKSKDGHRQGDEDG